MENEVIAQQLGQEQRRRANEILSSVPLVALASGRPGNVQTVEDVLTHVETIVKYLRFQMAQHEETGDQLTAIQKDLRAAGRLFALMTQEEA